MNFKRSLSSLVMMGLLAFAAPAFADEPVLSVGVSRSIVMSASGITSVAQVNGKYNTNAYDKLVYDLLYIQNYSVANDFIIMLQTIKVMITKEATEGVK